MEAKLTFQIHILFFSSMFTSAKSEDNTLYQRESTSEGTGQVPAGEICITVFILRDYAIPRGDQQAQPTRRTEQLPNTTKHEVFL